MRLLTSPTPGAGNGGERGPGAHPERKQRSGGRPAREGPPRLSARELEVARLVRDGLASKEIAARLGIADATVKVYLGHAFRKLGLVSRSQLAVWVERREREQGNS